ncbi:N-acetylneuraminate synthase family protein, partial [Metapseudomonas otitidis]
MNTIAEATGLPVGYSDHTLGLAVSTAAVALGATVIEKHFTLDKSLPGPDHQASLDPNELAQLVAQIRVAEQALGSSIKAP